MPLNVILAPTKLTINNKIDSSQRIPTWSSGGYALIRHFIISTITFERRALPL
jgi:hypothetical protein